MYDTWRLQLLTVKIKRLKIGIFLIKKQSYRFSTAPQHYSSPLRRHPRLPPALLHVLVIDALFLLQVLLDFAKTNHDENNFFNHRYSFLSLDCIPFININN
jgi:hypothetical protein